MADNKIYIIGAGAVGKALAVFLQLEGKNVIILRGHVDDQPAYTEEIQVVMADDKVLKANIEISTLSNFTRLNGLVVLTNKSYGNEYLSQTLRNKINDTPVVILQNGLGIEQTFIDNNFPEIYRCVLFLTSQPATGNKISYKPVSPSPIGIIKGNSTRLQEIVDQLSSSHFQFRVEHEIQPIIWKKAIINCVFNSICPLLDTDNGIFHRDPAVFAVAKRVVTECVAISRESGITLDVEAVLTGILLISKSSDGQFISTLQDIRNRKETEIDTLNLRIAGIATAMNMGSMVKETRLLGELTKLKSNIHR